MTKLRLLALVTFANPIALGCSSDGDGGSEESDGSTRQQDRDASAVTQNDAGMSGGCSGCGASEGCVQIDVSVKSDSADLPWKLWPDKSSGTGRLFAGVFGVGTPVSAKYEDEVDLKALTGKKSFDVCSTVGSVSAFCFLDDKKDGTLQMPSDTLRGSGDYIDTCTAERQVKVDVTVGNRATLACSLSVSCD